MKPFDYRNIAFLLVFALLVLLLTTLRAFSLFVLVLGGVAIALLVASWVIRKMTDRVVSKRMREGGEE